jgi:hypothetical protein
MFIKSLIGGGGWFVVASRCVCVFITAVPIVKLFAWGEGDSGGHFYERRRAEACAD